MHGNSRTSRKSSCKTPSSLGILIASEMEWEEKRRGGGLEQGEMAEMVRHWRWSLVKLQFAWQQWHRKKDPRRETMSRNYPTKTAATTDATPSKKVLLFCNFSPSFNLFISWPCSHGNWSFSKSREIWKQFGLVGQSGWLISLTLQTRAILDTLVWLGYAICSWLLSVKKK